MKLPGSAAHPCLPSSAGGISTGKQARMPALPESFGGESNETHQLRRSTQSLAQNLNHHNTDFTHPDADPSAGLHRAAPDFHLSVLPAPRSLADRTACRGMEDMGAFFRLAIPAPAAARRFDAR